MFEESFQWVSREFERSSKGNSGNFQFQGVFKEVLRMLQERFKGVSRKIEGCFKAVSKTF